MIESDNLIIFRTVAGESYGYGHLMRCLSLAHAFKAQGVQTSFMLADAPSNVQKLIRASGSDLVELPKQILPQDDLKELIAYANDRRVTGVVLDGYQFDQTYLDDLSNAFLCLFFDDLQELVPTSRLVLNQNPEAQAADYQKLPGQVLLLGLEYALLRPQFIKQRRESPRQNPKIASRLLVTFGGADPNALCARALLGLTSSKYQYEIKAIAGGSPGSLIATQAAAAESPHQVEVLERVENMASLMSWADFALCGSGVTGYEMCCLGLPMVVVTPVENQIPISRGMEKAGLIKHLGWWENVDGKIMAQAVDSLAKDLVARNELTRLAQIAVDGHGTERVAKALLEESEKWPS